MEGTGRLSGIVQQLFPDANTISSNVGNGIEITGNATGTTVEGNQITANAQNGVEVDGDLKGAATVATIQFNFIGYAPGVFSATGNALSGLLLTNTSTVYSTGTAVSVSGNVISENGLSGITAQSSVSGTPAGSVLTALITKNIIGLDNTGQFAVAPATSSLNGPIIPLGNALDGVLIDNVVGVTVGSTVSGTAPPTTPYNVIAGNLGRGIEVRGDFGAAPGAPPANLIEGNFIGTDISGTLGVNTQATSGSDLSGQQLYTLGNLSDGIFLFVPQATTIENNLISNNRAAGIHAATQAASPTGALTIHGNYIGTDATGKKVVDANHPTIFIGNGSDGIFLDSIASNTLGVTTISGNVISGNRANGIDLLDSTAIAIQGNMIGTDTAGTATGLGNASNGIFLNNSNENSIGGTASGSPQHHFGEPWKWRLHLGAG